MSLNPALALVAACGTIFGAWFAAGKLTEESAAPDRNVREPPARAQPVPAGRVLALRRVAPLPGLAEREPPPRPKPAPAEPAPAAPPPTINTSAAPAAAPAPAPAPAPAQPPPPAPVVPSTPAAPTEFYDGG